MIKSEDYTSLALIPGLTPGTDGARYHGAYNLSSFGDMVIAMLTLVGSGRPFGV